MMPFPLGRLLRGGLLIASLGSVACGAAASGARDGPSPEAVRAYTEAGLLAQAGRHAEAARRYDEAAAADPDTAEVWLAASRAWGQLGEWDAAAERAEKAVALAPDDVRAADALGQTMVAAGRLDDADRLYAALTHKHPEAAEGYSGVAAVAALRGDLETAAAALEQAVERAPDQADDWERLGALHQRLNRPAAAAVAYDHAATLDPSRRNLDPRTVLLALDGGDREVARRVARRIAGDDADEADGSLAIAALLIKREDPLGAANELEWLLERRPDDARAHLMMAHVLLAVERLDDARHHLEAVAPGTREWPDALRVRAMLALQADAPEEAIPLLRQARAAVAGQRDIVLELAHALRRAGRLPEARSELTLAAAEWPGDARIGYLLALIVQEMDGDAAAVTAMQSVLAIDADHAGALNFIGYTWADQGVRLDEAEAMIRRALSGRPDDGAIVDSLGWVLYRKGDLAAAETALRRAIELSPDVGEIHFHLAEVLRAQRREPEARAAYQEAVEHARDDAEKARFAKAAKRRGR